MKTDRELILEREKEELIAYVLGRLPNHMQSIFCVDHVPENNTLPKQESRVFDEVMAKTEILPPEAQEDYSGPRAYCPLCNTGSTQPDKPGFAYPKGLSQHLKQGYNCIPFKYGIRSVQKQWQYQFGEQEAQENNQKLEEKAQRKKHEIVYRIHPTAEPELLDELFFEKCRTAESLLFAENRLSDLGMLIHNEGNIRSYTQDHGQYILFADPRAEGKITFMLYLKNPPKRRKLNPKLMDILETLTIYDRCKHGLKLKLNTFCERLIAKQTQKIPL